MKVYVIYQNETEGMVLVYAHSEKRAMELFKTSEVSPVQINGIDLEDVKVDVFPTRMVVKMHTEGIREYGISTELSYCIAVNL